MIVQDCKNPAASHSSMKTLPVQRQDIVPAPENPLENPSFIARAQSLFNRMVGVEQAMPDCFSEQTFWESSSQVLQLPAAWRRDPELRKAVRIH